MESKELALMLECTQVPVISENLMDVGVELQTQLDMVRSLPRDREHAAQVKKLRAKYNKLFSEAEEGRKAVKKQCLAPYERAEKLYNGFVRDHFRALDAECKAFADQVEGQEKAECEERLKEYFSELCAVKGIHWLKWERLGIKVDLATARLAEPRKAMERIREKVEEVASALEAITGMEDAPSVLAEYEQCLDLARALQQVAARKQAAEIARKDAREWEERKSQPEAVRGAIRAAQVGTVELPQSEKTFRVTFTVTATMPMLRGLKAWLDSRNYDYQEVT